jgi:hypothetical protein
MGEFRVELRLWLGYRVVTDRLVLREELLELLCRGIVTDLELVLGDRLDRVVTCLLLDELPVLRDGLLRTTILPVDRLLLIEPLE